MSYDVYLNKIKNESIKPDVPKCFLGAWYHKVFSSKDTWEGIEGTITLPNVDIQRFNGDKNLDTPSIYMGGLAKYESDVGLSFMGGKVIVDEKEVINPYGTVFRPFWRYITDLETDEGSYDYENGRNYNVSNLTPNATTSNCYAHYSPNFTEYYYLPGDKLKMIITYPKKNHMQLTIEVLEVSSLESSIKLRKLNKWSNPKTFKSPLFTSPENIETNLKEFKRVNAIDQSGNEGKPTINTNTTISNAIWESVYLFRTIDNKVYKVPFNDNRAGIMNCPTINGFETSNIDNITGGEIVTIIPRKLI